MTDLKLYQEFVSAVTSDESNHNYAFLDRFEKLSNYQEDNTKINPALLLTAGMGLSAESGEFNEIIKKIYDGSIKHFSTSVLEIVTGFSINSLLPLQQHTV